MTALGTNLLDKRTARALGLSSSTLEFIRGEVKPNGRPPLPLEQKKPKRDYRHERLLAIEAKALAKHEGRGAFK